MGESVLSEKRRLIGIIAIVCFLVSLVLWIAGADFRSNPMVASLPRVGIVLATLWYAMPKQGGELVWSKALVPLIAIIAMVALLRRAAWWILPGIIVVAIALAIIRPKNGGKRRV